MNVGGTMARVGFVAMIVCAMTVGAQSPDAAAVQQAVDRMRAGLEQHNLQVMLAAFDERRMVNFAQFREQLAAYFQQHASFRVRTHRLTTETAGDSATSLVEIEVEAQPVGGEPPTRKTGQLRIEVGRSGDTWKIRELAPRSFFR